MNDVMNDVMSWQVQSALAWFAMMASNAILDWLNCTLNEQVSFFEKAKKLSEIKRLCRETLSSNYKAKCGIERELFVCNFA